MTAVDRPSLAGHPADGPDQHLPLGDLDPLVQGLGGVVVVDGHRDLGDDGAGVDSLVDDVTLVVSELATNAVKYGALSSASGAIHLSWSFEADARRLQLYWRESGGPQVDPPSRRGFGSRLIERAFRGGDLSGSSALDFNPSGLRCTVEAVLPA